MREHVLTRRELNRALLARRFLLRREQMPVLRALERLAGLQALWEPSVAIGLWTRLEWFGREELDRALTRRTAVRATVMRATIHLVSTRDYLLFYPALRSMLQRKVASAPIAHGRAPRAGQTGRPRRCRGGRATAVG